MSAAVENAAASAASTAQNAVESLTEAVKNTSLGPKVDTTEADAAHAASAAEGRRLYIGNLAYSTTDDQLKGFFTGYSVESTSIPTHPRTGRAVGYAFVDLTTKEEADRAISELNGKEFLERTVSVQLARKPGANTKEPKKEGEEKEAGATEGGEEKPHTKKTRGSTRGRGRARGRGGLHKSEDGKEITAPAEGSGQAQPLVESTNTNAKAEATEQDGQNHVSNVVKPKKKRGPPENGIPSSTKIMVANLPYELGEQELKDLFAAYQPEAAKIALRPIPRYMVRKLQARGEARKGRGFGFVTLASEEMQQKAVNEMNGKVVEGREIAVKVAIDKSQAHEAEDKENDGEVKADKVETQQNGVTAEATTEAA